MTDTFAFSYNASINQSFEGQLASSYTNWVNGQVKAIGDYIAYKWYEASGKTSADLAKAIEISNALEAGKFQVSDLFLAAQTKGVVDLTDIAGVPTPDVTVAGVTFNLNQFFGTTTFTADWQSGSAKNAITHSREYLTSFSTTPPSYNENWQNPNSPPVAQGGTASGNEDTTIGGHVTALDPDNNPLTYSLVTNVDPSKGTLHFNADGTYTFDPAANFNGQVSFTYKANDGSLNSNTATVTITVNAVNDAPVAHNDIATTSEDTPVNINVLGNDTDIDSATLSVSGTPTALHGTVSVNPNGTLHYIPDADYNGTDTISYTVTDGALTSDATVSVTINAVNDAPVAHNDTATTDEDTPVNINVLANDTDIDSATLSVAGTPTALHGTVSVNANGTLHYVPDADYNGTDTISYTVTDGSLTSDATVSVTINAVNDAPVAHNDTATTDEDTPVNINVLANDTDIDSATLSVSGTPTALHGTVSVNANGTLHYVPDGDYNGTDTISYTVTDGSLTSDATVSVTINAVNDAPVAHNDTATTDEDTPVNINVLANDTDIDSATLSVSGTPTALHGTVSVNPNGTLHYIPDADYNGTDTISYTVTDGSLTSDATVSVTINAVNDAPVAHNDTATTDEDTATDINVLGNDTDIDSATLSVSGTPTALHGTVSVNANGTLHYVPDADYNGTDTISYTVTDGSLTSDATVAVTINAVNDAPVAHNDTASTDEDTPVNINVLGNDTDIDSATLSVSGTPTALHGTVSGNANGTLHYVPDADYNGTDTISYTVTDGALTSDATVAVTINAVNDAPVAHNDTATTDEDTPVNINVLGNDTDIDSATLSVAGTPTALHGTVSVNANGTLHYVPDADYNGTDTISYTVSDGSFTSDATVAVTINAVNDAPSGLKFVPTTDGSSTTPGFFTANDPDSTITYSVTGSSGITVDATTGALGIAGNLAGTTQSITVTASDGTTSTSLDYKVLLGQTGGGAGANDTMPGGAYVIAADNNIMIARNGTDTLTGSAGTDYILGGNDVDTIHGGGGDDVIVGGAGADNLWGDAGADTFKYISASDSSNANPDVITGFVSGTDKLDLTTIDPSSAAGNQAFAWGGQQAGATTLANGITWYADAQGVHVLGDTNGAAGAEFHVLLAGISTVSQSDFVL